MLSQARPASDAQSALTYSNELAFIRGNEEIILMNRVLICSLSYKGVTL